ncbi:MAG: Rieske 2Fe-2S domain-containing protein [Acidimicrobiales bacterium]
MTSSSETSTETVARAEDLSPGTMRMVTVGGRAVALVTTDTGIYALDNACPHQGYGLVTGTLAGGTVTCQWHNWKFDVTTGRCLMGEEDVACHRVTVTDGEVQVTVRRPSAAETRERVWPSLRRGLAADYMGQVARDTIRLLDAGATPAEVMAEAVRARAAHTEEGVGHEMAMAADCLARAEAAEGDERVLPLVQGLSGWAEETRDRAGLPLPPPDDSIDLAAAVEAEDEAGALASVRGQLAAGVGRDAVRHQLLVAASAHHLSYGHGIIYTQKAFELLDRIGWDAAPDLLPHLSRTLVRATREDTLPYMRHAVRALAEVDLEALAAAPGPGATGWSAGPRLTAELLGATGAAPITRAATAVVEGAGVDGLLDAVVDAVSLRLLGHDVALEHDHGDGFGWLDITHGLTMAEAARWAWRADPGPHTARLALWATWLLFDTGRAERRRRGGGTAPSPTSAEEAGGRYGVRASAEAGAELAAAVQDRRGGEAVALALGSDPEVVGEALAAAALADGAGSFIVVAHLVKTAEAARREAGRRATALPLAGAARYLASPRRERFVARNVADSLGFLRTGRPPRR